MFLGHITSVISHPLTIFPSGVECGYMAIKDKEPSNKAVDFDNFAQVERFFLNRLETFAMLCIDLENNSQEMRRLARHAALSCYRDLEAIGLKEQAREILGRTIGQRPLNG
jgi:hypothetical protein